MTHIYVRQLINGLEVSDGDISINIDRDGRVLSWGNSFHPGAVGGGYDGRAAMCNTLRLTKAAHESELARVTGRQGVVGMVKAAAQVVLPSWAIPSDEIDIEAVEEAQASLQTVDHHIDAVCSSGSATAGITPTHALVALLDKITANDVELSHSDLMSAPHNTFSPKAAPAEPPTQLISGPALEAAGVRGDVPARLMFTQVDGGEPRLAWKLEVEMKDNWYEAYVDTETGDILRIVDWASDAGPVRTRKGGKGDKQKPLPTPPKKIEPYTYQVFPWGERALMSMVPD